MRLAINIPFSDRLNFIQTEVIAGLSGVILIMCEVNGGGNMCIVISKFQGKRGNQATRSLTEWRYRTGHFGTIEIETCVLHLRHLSLDQFCPFPNFQKLSRV